jgi:hypothetical protein
LALITIRERYVKLSEKAILGERGKYILSTDQRAVYFHGKLETFMSGIPLTPEHEN